MPTPIPLTMQGTHSVFQSAPADCHHQLVAGVRLFDDPIETKTTSFHVMVLRFVQQQANVKFLTPDLRQG